MSKENPDKPDRKVKSYRKCETCKFARGENCRCYYVLITENSDRGHPKASFRLQGSCWAWEAE